MQWKKYKKTDAFSYSFGAFPTGELIEKRPELIEEVIFSEQFHELGEWTARLKSRNIRWRVSDRAIRRIAPKGNIYVVGAFRKEAGEISDGNHVVLDRISDMGNLGNICRTMTAMGIFDLALIGTCCDYFDPKTIRASMGASFLIRVSSFETVDEYLERFGKDRTNYLFMLSETATIPLPKVVPQGKWSAFFGNEGAGLPAEYEKYGTCVRIPQSEFVDSLNLTTAVALGLYHFSNFGGTE